MVTYLGDPQVRLERWSSISEGAVANASRLDSASTPGRTTTRRSTSSMAGAGAEKLPLEVLAGSCVVFGTHGLSLDEVARAPEDAERILFKTQNSEFWTQDEFPEEFTRRGGQAAKLLVNRSVKLVGRLALGRRRGGASHPARGRRRPDQGVDLRGLDPAE